jgi:hypothetical protein
MRTIGLLSIALGAMVPTVAAAKCPAAFDRLPSRFHEIASGELINGMELFVATDGRCTCDNSQASRENLRLSAPREINWTCRRATAVERRPM